MQILQSLGRWLGWPRPQLPARYSDGWQTSLPPSAMAGSPSPEGFAALQRGAQIVIGQLTSTPLLSFLEDEETPASAAARCLNRTNPAHFELGVSDMFWHGNGLLKIHRDGNAPHHLEAVQAHRFSVSLVNGEAVYSVDGQPIDMKDYIHLMARNSTSAVVGDGILESFSASIQAIVSVLSLHAQLHQNGGSAEAYLLTDQNLSQDQMKQLREAHSNQTANARGAAAGTVILSSGLKPSVMRKLPSALDADIIKNLDFSVAEASRIVGVPLSFLGVKDAVAYNSAIEASRAFHKTTVRPLQYRIEQELTQKLGSRIVFDQGEVALGQGRERAEVLTKLVFAGVLSMDEARQALGYSPVGGRAAELWIGSNMAAIDDVKLEPV